MNDKEDYAGLIEQLKALRMRWRSIIKSYNFGDQLDGDFDTLDEAASALTTLTQDAKRYQWLKANHLQTGPDSWIRTGDDLEETIDAAMKGESDGR